MIDPLLTAAQANHMNLNQAPLQLEGIVSGY